MSVDIMPSDDQLTEEIRAMRDEIHTLTTKVVGIEMAVSHIMGILSAGGPKALIKYLVTGGK